jgi:SGF29 tudor-like domain/Sin3 binding region of histone deacetylase complex subunit SAP30
MSSPLSDPQITSSKGSFSSHATGNKVVRRSSHVKPSHSRSYPRGVGLDFRKLPGISLINYIDHHGALFIVSQMLLSTSTNIQNIYCLLITLKTGFHSSTGVHVRPEAPPSELAVGVARHFEAMDVNEEDCIGGFLERLEKGPGAATDYARQTAFFDGRAPPLALRKRQRNKLAARPGEQVAAKVTRTDENGSWILASVTRFYADTETYDVQDDDDTSKLIRLPWNHVMRLSMGTEGCFQKGKDCMAIFPETTSFYRAKVSKNPVWKLDRHRSPIVAQMIVKFEDDEDANGRTPHRRVPARYVIPIPADYFYDETEDVDLSLLGQK